MADKNSQLSPAELQRQNVESVAADGNDERVSIPCSMCGKPTTFDPTYGDLCYRCCRADNE